MDESDLLRSKSQPHILGSLRGALIWFCVQLRTAVYSGIDSIGQVEWID